MARSGWFASSLLTAALAAGAARAGGAGTTGAVAVKVPSGARPAAMGGANTGLADDQNALFWNPAGLADVKASEVGLMYTNFLVDTSYQLLSYTRPFPVLGGGISAAVNTLSYGKIALTQEQPNGQYGGTNGSITPREWFLIAGWGTPLPPMFGLEHLRAGVSAKMTFQPVALGELMGVGLSGGALWEDATGRLRVGTLADNLGALAAGGGLLPITWRLGGSYRQPVGDRLAVTGAADSQLMIDTGWRVNAGLELVAYDFVAIRGGWSAGDAVQPAGPTFGAGIVTPSAWFGKRNRLTLDWALGSYGALGTAQRVQMTLQFGGGSGGEAPALAPTSAPKPVAVKKKLAKASSSPSAAPVAAASPVAGRALSAPPGGAVEGPKPVAAPTEAPSASAGAPHGVISSLAVADGANGSVLSWKGPGSTFDVLCRRPWSKDWAPLNDAPVTGQTYHITGLKAGKYVVKIVAMDLTKPGASGAESSELDVTLH